MTHKRLSLGLLAVMVVFVVLALPAILGSGRIGDGSPCSTWSSADHAAQTAYARLYLSEHGALPSGARSPQSVESAINGGCAAASINADADTVTVLEAINGQY